MGKVGRILAGGLTGGLVGAGRAAGFDVSDIARHGGLGIMGMLAAKKKKRGEADDEGRPATGGRGDVDAMMGRSAGRNVEAGEGMKRGGKAKVKKMAKGGSTASKRADGCAQRGKTKGRFV